MISSLASRGLVTTLFVLLLVLAACGGSTATGGADTNGGGEEPAGADGGGDGSGVDVCAVLSLEEVSNATGVEVTDATGFDSNEVSSCNWSDASGAPVFGTTYTRGNEAINPEQMLDANAGGAGEEIPDVGDRAVLAGDDDFPILLVLKGGALYSLSVITDELDAQGKRDATIELARLSADRLP